MQIAVGAPTTSGGGHVSIFNFDATAGAVTCAMALTGAEAHFGRSMTLVDLDPSNGTEPDHLLVGAPQTHAYLYKLPLSAGAAPVAMATETMPLANFGFSVAAFDIDGKPGDEMFIGSPDATVGNTTTAGQVFVYTGATMTLLPSTPTFPNPLAEHEPGAGRGYGMAIAGMTLLRGARAPTAARASARSSRWSARGRRSSPTSRWARSTRGRSKAASDELLAEAQRRQRDERDQDRAQPDQLGRDVARSCAPLSVMPRTMRRKCVSGSACASNCAGARHAPRTGT